MGLHPPVPSVFLGPILKSCVLSLCARSIVISSVPLVLPLLVLHWPSLDMSLSLHRDVCQTPTFNIPSWAPHLCSVLSLPFSLDWLSRWGYQGLPSVYPAWELLTLVSPFYYHGAVLVQAFIISSMDHCRCFSTDLLFRLGVLLSVLYTQSVFLKCILLLSPSLVWNWSVVFRTQAAYWMPSLFPGFRGISRST